MFNFKNNPLGKIKIGNKFVGQDAPTFFIAEIGNNHNGDYYLAKKSIEEAVKAGADAVKIQKRTVKDVFARELLEKPQTKDQIYGKTYGEYRQRLELNDDDIVKLKQYADELGVIFFATPFDKISADFLESIGSDLYKIASFDVTNLPLLEHVAKKGKPIILSVGMSDWDEVDEAVETILKYNDQLIIKHCVSVYPTPDEKINLTTMTKLRERYNPLPIGYSGHEQDILPTLAAVALGAKTIERHFTLDKHLPGPDHATVSIEPEEFKSMVDSARRIEKALGDGLSKLLEDELKAREKHGKSIVSATDIKAGQVITPEMVTIKSPGYGLKPNMVGQLIGKTAKVDIESDSVITKELINW
ncbi:MAG: N-acetylneuraminate synthase family protein [Candidatus Buchananbacteria bacterium]|nr:N-acetylneuraminate synthase family protein [Candidatus Buchananbacteria bacterium]